jgi:hypothetical protein
MSTINKIASEPASQTVKSSHGKKVNDNSFAEILNSAKAQSADANPSDAPFPGGCMEPMQFPVSENEPFRSADQLLNKFLAKAGRHVHFAEISAAYSYARHELKTAGLPMPNSAQDFLMLVIGKAAEFEENSAGNQNKVSPLRQQLAEFIASANVQST